MICPVCAQEMAVKNAGDIPLDVCWGGCGGIWFDAFELARLSQAPPETMEWMAQVPVQEAQIPAHKLQCPRCSLPLMRRLFKPAVKVVVDECPGCGGFWLDHGEWDRIQTHSASAEASDQPDKLTLARQMYRQLCARQEP
jgi:Zn-finger nucleic acid-binding protein